MQEIYVKNVIIGKQYESCKNYEKFKDIVEDKKINVIAFSATSSMSPVNNIEKFLYINLHTKELLLIAFVFILFSPAWP